MIDDMNSDNIMLQHLLESMPIDEYEGRTSKEMQYMVYDPFCENSPLIVKPEIENSTLMQVPFFNLMRYFLEIISENESIKLTPKGFLPLKVVNSIFSKNFIHEDFQLKENEKIVKEHESLAVTNVRIIAEQAGLVKNRKNEMSLTKKGQQLLKNNNYRLLFFEILNVFTTKFNWSYNDGYGDNEIGQFGFAYTLDLIEKYGTISRSPQFYAAKYREIFKSLLTGSQKIFDWSFSDSEFDQCFSLRTIERFLIWFGFVNITDETEGHEFEYRIEKSELFNAIFGFE